jgi:hypothetical protein
MRNLPVDEFHRRFGKEHAGIADCLVPSFYTSATAEFTAALSMPVLIDRSFLGLARISGKDAGNLLHRLTTNEMRHLQAGQGVVNIFTTAKGRILDVVEMLRRNEDYLLITSAGRAATVLQWIDKYTFIEEVHGEELTERDALFSIFGKISDGFAGPAFDDLPFQHFRNAQIDGVEVMVQRTNGIAPDGYNVIANVEGASIVWEFLRRHAEPIGFSAYEALRVHAGIPAADAEITEQQNPHEVNLLAFINFEKGCYIGQEVVARLDTYDKVQRRLVGVEFESERVPAPKSSLWIDDAEVGVVTSAVFSPVRQKAIGLGILHRKFAEAGCRLVARHEGASWHCIVVALPFV